MHKRISTGVTSTIAGHPLLGQGWWVPPTDLCPGTKCIQFHSNMWTCVYMFLYRYIIMYCKCTYDCAYMYISKCVHVFHSLPQYACKHRPRQRGEDLNNFSIPSLFWGSPPARKPPFTGIAPHNPWHFDDCTTYALGVSWATDERHGTSLHQIPNPTRNATRRRLLSLSPAILSQASKNHPRPMLPREVSPKTQWLVGCLKSTTTMGYLHLFTTVMCECYYDSCYNSEEKTLRTKLCVCMSFCFGVV